MSCVSLWTDNLHHGFVSISRTQLILKTIILLGSREDEPYASAHRNETEGRPEHVRHAHNLQRDRYEVTMRFTFCFFVSPHTLSDGNCSFCSNEQLFYWKHSRNVAKYWAWSGKLAVDWTNIFIGLRNTDHFVGRGMKSISSNRKLPCLGLSSRV